jgi:phosphopantothenoylcysteine decarboxylase/phosphopantothenate--cysteine ligase
MLKGKNIILGITGSIAAYKAATLTRLFVKNGANVKIILSPYAKEFITPVTLGTLSKNTVLSDFFRHDDGAWNSHVDLGIWADLMIIAPATANTMAKMSAGICDNLLLTTYLSARCQVMFAPAMDLDMYSHPSTQHNIDVLRKRGHLFCETPSGELASGLSGKGRMEEPENILNSVINYFNISESLKGKKILVTAGPTFEAIDPVRFIGNHSSGKMGYAIAGELAQRGASVILVSGPVTERINHPNITLINVISAHEMFKACSSIYEDVNAAIFAAAVADYQPENPELYKIKSSDSDYNLKLKPTIDIALTLGKRKKARQINVGFALETNNEVYSANAKLKSKNFDFIVLNSLKDEGAGFKISTNKITIIHQNGTSFAYEVKLKEHVAIDIVNELAKLM